MRRLSALILFFAPGFVVSAQTPQQLADNALKQSNVPCQGVTTAKQCHTKYAAGCGRTASSQYDAYLDFFKNQVTPTSAQPSETVDPKKLQELESATPTGLVEGNHKDFSAQFVKLNEGEIVDAIGYLYYAESTGPESSNCYLKNPANVDMHIGIGFDAGRVAEAKASPAKGTPKFLDLQAHSMIVEMTPHTRPATWTLAKVQAAYGRQVRVVGQLIADNDHHTTSDDCAINGATSTCWRLSIWEIHPVTSFYVCTTSGGCTTATSPGWKKLEAWSPSGGGKHPKKPVKSPPA